MPTVIRKTSFFRREVDISNPRPGPDLEEARQIAEILDGRGDGFGMFDFNWRILYFNRVAGAFFGVRPQDAIGRVIWDIHPGSPIERVRPFLERVMTNRAPAELETPSEYYPGRWINVRAFPLASGLGVDFRDVTEQRARLEREHEQALRMELALEMAGFGDWRWDPATDRVDLSERAAALIGLPPGKATWSELIRFVHPDDRNAARASILAALEHRQAYQFEYRMTRPDGAQRWILIRARTLVDDDGRAMGVLGVLSDVTANRLEQARVRADRARLAELERRRAYLLEVADALRALDDPDEILATAAKIMAARLNVDRVGYGEVDDDDLLDIRGEFVTASLPPLHEQILDLKEMDPTVVENLRRGLALVLDDVRRDPRIGPAPGAYGDKTLRAMIVAPLVRDGRLNALFYAHHSQPRGWTRDDVSLMEDVAARTWTALSRARIELHAAERQRLLINELNHRVKNTLATIQSLTQQTLRDGVDARVGREHLTNRLLALSAAHNVLTRENWKGADLLDIACEAIRPFDDPVGELFTLTGPRARLDPNVALALSMAFHELATNAVKYGSLSTPRGSVEIEWRRSDAGVEIEWRESGGPRVTPPVARGFGSRLLASLKGELGAAAVIDYRPEGVVCRLRAPLA